MPNAGDPNERKCEVKLDRRRTGLAGADEPAPDMSTPSPSRQQRPTNSSISRRRWSAEEDAFIGDRYPICGATAVADSLERTPEAVRKRAQRLGVPGPNDRFRNNTTARIWTQAQDRCLAVAYEQGGMQAARKALLDRSEVSIRDRVRLLGLKCSRRDLGGRKKRWKQGQGDFEFIRQQAEGRGIEWCAEQLGLSYGRTYELAIASGALSNPAPRAWTDSETDRLQSMHADGTPANQIAYLLGRGIQAVETKIARIARLREIA